MGANEVNTLYRCTQSVAVKRTEGELCSEGLCSLRLRLAEHAHKCQRVAHSEQGRGVEAQHKRLRTVQEAVPVTIA